jgi:hypothetical protein
VAALDLPLTTGECFVLGATPAERFDLLVFHRGLHCPLCAKYRIELERLMPGFALRRVNVLAIRSDTKELGQEMARKGNINININININTSGVRSAPSLSLKSAREWGPYTSASRGKTSIGTEEPALFSEPAVYLVVYLVRPDGTLYCGAVPAMLFAQLAFADLLDAIDFAISQDHPARGAFTGAV